MLGYGGREGRAGLPLALLHRDTGSAKSSIIESEDEQHDY